MKTAILTLTLLLFALPAFAQTPVNASSLAAPLPLATPAPAPAVAAIIVASLNGGPYRAGSFNIHVGDVMVFKLLQPTSAPLPSMLTVKVNGKDLSLPSGATLAFTADKAGVWNIALDMAGFASNRIVVVASQMTVP
ncbi:MAG: hypothetical protein ACREQE_07630 [Candidatus Binataceae bacterium]